MIHIIKESFYINVNHEIVMGELDILVNLCDCVFLASVGSKPIAVVMELRFADWLQHLQYTLLY